jgi:deoxyribonuclease-4
VAESDLNLQDLFRALFDYKAGGRILCESPIMEQDALYMKKIWQEVSGEES